MHKGPDHFHIKNITMTLKAENVNCEKQGADDQAHKYIHIF